MAKLNHVLFGQAKGKVGGMVLQRYEGMNIVREKPISVKNPQTTKQTQQRAMFKLASQFVGIYADAINIRLSELSIYARSRRASAINAVLSATDFDPSTEDIAQVNLADAISAINAKSMSEYAAPQVIIANTNFEVTAPADSIVFGVIASFDNHGHLVDRKLVSSESTGSAITFPTLSSGVAQRAVFVYTIPVTEEGHASFSNISAVDSNFETQIFRSVNAGDMKVSGLVGIEYPEI